HVLGGYNTWAARSAGLEVEAEPKIVEAALRQLEIVTGQPRRKYVQSAGTAAKAILDAKPVAYWRLDEWQGPRAVDRSGHQRDAIYETGVVYFLDGPRSDAFCEDEVNRAAHFAGGRLESRVDGLGDKYTISLWFWNGMPLDGRDIAGWMFSRGHNYGRGPSDVHLGLGGKQHPGKLVLQCGDTELVAGRTTIERWTWNHAALVRDGDKVQVYLNGNAEPELTAAVTDALGSDSDRLYFGGRSDKQDGWEGRLDE